MDKKIIFGFVFLLLISSVIGATVTETGYFGSHSLREWSAGKSNEQLLFIGGDNLTIDARLPKYSNITHAELDINVSSDIQDFYLDIGVMDGVYEFEATTVTNKSYDVEFGIDNVYRVFKLNNNTGTIVWDDLGNDSGNIHNINDGQWVSGKFNNAIELNNTNDRIDTDWKPFPKDSWAISFWMNTTGGVGDEWIIDTDTGAGKSYMRLRRDTTTSKMFFEMGDVSVGGNRIQFSLDDYSNWSTNQWVHVGIVKREGRTGHELVTIYRDGVEITERNVTTSGTIDDLDFTDDIFFGSTNSPNDWDGLLDEILIFQGSNVSQSDITSVYQGNYTSLLTPGVNYTSPDLAAPINTYLAICDEDLAGYCNVSFTFNSNSSGVMDLFLDNTINYTLQYNFTFNDQTYENEENEYELVVYSYDPTLVDSIFYFNNTGYAPSSFSYGAGYKTMSYSFDTPFYGSAETFNAPMYWAVEDNLNNSNTSTYTQLVYRLNLAKCSEQPTWKEVINILTLDEEENGTSYINTTINLNANIWFNNENLLQNFSFQFTDNFNYSLCVYPNSTGYVNSIMEYFAPGYANRKYYLDNYSIDWENPKQLLLYNLNESKSSDVTLYVYDRNTGEAVTGAYVKILRYYPETGAYRTVEIEKTDDNGYSLGKMVVADVFYKFIVEYDRTVVLNSAVERIVSLSKQLPVIISGDLLESWRSIDDISGSVTCTESTQICRFTWSDSSNLVQTASMKVYRLNGYGKTLINEQSATAASGSLVYTIVENVTGNEYLAVGYIHTNTANSFYTIGQAYARYREGISDVFGVGALLPMFLLLVVMGAVLLDVGAVGVIAGSLIALIAGVMIGIIPFGITTLISFIIMGAVLIGKVKS